MKNFFSYDNKLMQLLMRIGDLIMLNVLYVVCCIPIVTVGAAQAGLYSGIRRLMNEEDDRSCVRAFFKGFISGFKQVTLVSTVFAVAMFLLVVLYSWLKLYDFAGFGAVPVWMCVALMGILAVTFSAVGPFHASFSCTTGQLMRNLLYVTMAYPFRSICVAALIYLPVVNLLMDLYGFLELTVLWLFLYYAMVFLLVHLLMRKPMAELKQLHMPAEESAN